MESFLAQKVYAEMPISSFNPCCHFLLNRQRLVSFTRYRFHTLSQKTQIQRNIICARNKKRKYGSARSGKVVLESAYHIASKLKILPEPLDLLIKEFGIGGGNRGGFSGFWKGSGWGGFDGWGWRRKKRKLEFLGILVILGLGLWMTLGKELDANALLRAIGLVLFGVSVNGWRRGIKDWALGFCCCAFLVGLVLKKEDFQKLAKSFGAVKLWRSRKRRVF